jgi:hypothetical protein
MSESGPESLPTMDDMSKIAAVRLVAEAMTAPGFLELKRWVDKRIAMLPQ